MWLVETGWKNILVVEVDVVDVVVVECVVSEKVQTIAVDEIVPMHKYKYKMDTRK